MSAMLDDHASTVVNYSAGGDQVFAGSDDAHDRPLIGPRQVTLRDRVTSATLIPFFSASDVAPTLLQYLCEQLNKEIDNGDTYPMMDPLSLREFQEYWFSYFGAVMLLGEVNTVEEIHTYGSKSWAKVCLGSFYIKPNFVGRSRHVCTGEFLVTDAARRRGVGKLMGESYLQWAPQLGYTYSIFNLVYDNNAASTKIWDALGFKRIGRIPGCGKLRSNPNELTDAIIYGRDLGDNAEDFVPEERFERIKYYLKHGTYPPETDRLGKSRLRSAATNYKLIPEANGEPEKLMMKGKEVISDPQRQYELARQLHLQQHGGINKTTSVISEKYHWVRIKDTVSQVIKNCHQCQETQKAPTVYPEVAAADGITTTNGKEKAARQNGNVTAEPSFAAENRMVHDSTYDMKQDPFSASDQESIVPEMDYSVLDPQIMADLQTQLPRYQGQPDLYSQATLHDPQHGMNQHGMTHSDFGNHTQMHHHHHDASGDYQMDHEHALIAQQAAAALHQQQMEFVDEDLDTETQALRQNFLSGSFPTNRDGNGHYDQ